MNFKIIFYAVFAVTLTIIGDYFVKKASLAPKFTHWHILLLGGAFYASSAILWFWMYRYTKVYTVGMLHSFLVIAFTLVLSVIVFKENITWRDGIGLALGVISMVLLLDNQ